MLPPYIIEDLRRREEARRELERQPMLELPLPLAWPGPKKEDQLEIERGVVIIELMR